MRDRRDGFKRFVDENLQRSLQVRDADIELDEVAIVLVVVEVEQIVSLAAKNLCNGSKLLDQSFHALHLVRSKRFELLNRGEHVDEFDDAATEQIEFAEDGLLGEVELLSFRHRQQFVLGQSIMLLVRLVQFETDVEILAQRLRIAVPERRGPALADVRLAPHDHLIRDLNEQRRHAVGRVVISGDRVDHFDRVHQRRQRVDDRAWRALVKGLKKLLECEQILDIVLGFVRGLGEIDIDVFPTA